MKRFLFFITVISLMKICNGRITSMETYNDDFSDVEFPDDRDDCIDGSCSLYAEKRLIVPEKIIERRRLVPQLSSGDFFRQSNSACGCETLSKIINLGEGHYPRYITIATCQRKKGVVQQCSYYHYRIQIFVKRKESSILKSDEELNSIYKRYRIQDIEEMVLPQNLRADWQLFALSVPVTCIGASGT